MWADSLLLPARAFTQPRLATECKRSNTKENLEAGQLIYKMEDVQEQDEAQNKVASFNGSQDG